MDCGAPLIAPHNLHSETDGFVCDKNTHISVLNFENFLEAMTPSYILGMGYKLQGCLQLAKMHLNT